MVIAPEVILYAKYAVSALIIFVIIMAPAYLAAQTKKSKVDTMRVRVASWLFGWTGIGWIMALIWAIKK